MLMFGLRLGTDPRVMVTTTRTDCETWSPIRHHSHHPGFDLREPRQPGRRLPPSSQEYKGARLAGKN